MLVRTVVLLRHATPVVDASVPTFSWCLSPEGVASCADMADDLRSFLPTTLAASPEPKAVETATAIANRLKLDVSTRDGLREHRRSGEFLPRSDFHSGIESFFKNPGKVVFGSESCEEQGLRIESEVEVALLHDSGKNAILVTHGSAMTSYIVRHWQVDPFDL